MPATSRRIAGFTESVIRRMTRVANECGAVNLSQGFPDFDPPPALIAAGLERMRAGPHQYAVTWGSPGFRAALAAKQSRFMGMEVDPERNIVVTCGSTEAMMAAMMTACDPGDAVVVFSPFYENYAADAILSGVEPRFVPLKPPRFEFDPAELERAIEGGGKRAKAIVLCNPANPSGKVFSREELLSIARIAAAKDLFVITDEVYEHIVYAPRAHTYMASLPGMASRTISCSSLSKTYSITGWRLGYIIADPAVIDGARKVHDFLTVGAAAPLMEAAIAALNFPDSYYAELAGSYARKKELFLGYLRRAGIPFHEPEGAYYVLADMGRYTGSGAPGAPADDTAFAEWLARKVGVATVPGSSFFREDVRNYVRFHFAKREATLAEAGEKLLRLDDAWAADFGRAR